MEGLKTAAMLFGGVTFFGFGYSLMSESGANPAIYLVPAVLAAACYILYKLKSGEKKL